MIYDAKNVSTANDLRVDLYLLTTPMWTLLVCAQLRKFASPLRVEVRRPFADISSFYLFSAQEILCHLKFGVQDINKEYN